MPRQQSAKRTANKHATPQQREAHLAAVARLYLTGHVQVEIARQTNVVQSQISYDLKILQRRWRTASATDFNEAKQRELARIDVLELEYWQAWRESKDQKTRTAIKRVGPQAQTVKEASTQTEERNGDPRYLKGVQWCIEQRCKLLGLNAPDFNIDLSNLSDEQVQRIARGESITSVLARANGSAGAGGTGTPQAGDSQSP